MSNDLCTIKNSLESKINYSLSLSNLELYHSNLLAFVIEKTKFVKHSFFSDVIDIEKDYEIKVYREKKSIDVTIELKDSENNTYFIFIENKVKSVPQLDQLKKYSEYNTFNKGILLSLVPPSFDLPSNWCFKKYTDLIKYYDDVIKIENEEWFKGFLSDYNGYMTELNKLIELFQDDKNYYLDIEKSDILNTMRLDSMISKLKYSKIAQELSSKLLVKDTYFGRIRGADFFGVVIPLDNINLEIDIQIQGKQYRHKINFPKELVNHNLIEICENLKSQKFLFNFNIDDSSILKKSNSNKDWKKYGLHHYDYAIIKEGTKIAELLDYIELDFKNIRNKLSDIGNIISEGLNFEK